MATQPASLAAPLAAAAARIARQVRARPALCAAAAALGLLLPPALAAALRSYRGYLALGPGGPPHNLLGWAFQGLAQLFALRDPRSALPFERPPADVVARYGGSVLAQKSYLDIDTTLPTRRGDRPVVPGYVAPQRQTTDAGPDPAATRARQESFLKALAAANPDVLDVRPSQLEGNATPALWARRTVGLGAALWDGAERKRGAGPRGPAEIVHAHAEASSHMQFSFGDARWVVQAGWGERHLLAGSGVARLPPTYLIVYAPRDAGELKVWKQLVMAAARFAVGESVDLNDAKE